MTTITLFGKSNMLYDHATQDMVYSTMMKTLLGRYDNYDYEIKCQCY